MKTNFLVFGLLIAALSINAQNSTKLDLIHENSGFKLNSRNSESISFTNEIDEIGISSVNYNGETFNRLHIDNYSFGKEIGFAELPVRYKLIEIPQGATVDVESTVLEEEVIDLDDDFNGHNIYPIQRTVSKSENLENVEFSYKTSKYEIDAFTNNKKVRVEILGEMRGVRLARIAVSPFDYNPVTNELKVVSNMEINVKFKNADISATNDLKSKYFSPAFEGVLNKVINHEGSQNRDHLMTYPVTYVIVSDRAFEDALQPFIEWKTKKGFNVIEAYTDEFSVGNTTESIKDYLQDLYDNPVGDEMAQSYVLLVGDVDQIPSFDGVQGDHKSDMYYVEYTGDYLPEAYIGRFSAETADQVTVQVNKTLEYEKYQFPDPSFLDRVLMISGVDASMAPTYGNGQINYGNQYYFNEEHGFDNITYLYPESESMASQIKSRANEGNCFINYTAHGFESGWADPSFTNSDVNNMTNAHEYPLMVGNCCLTNVFTDASCFGETLLRAENKGAIGYIGGSNVTYWNEDYWWGVGAGEINANPSMENYGLGVYDCAFHENGEDTEDWFESNGQIIVAGNIGVTEGGGMWQYYYEVYHLMGDPSLMTYFGVPSALTVQHDGAKPVGTSTLTVTTEAYAYVAISKDGVLLDAQLADATGVVNLSFDAVNSVAVADVVVTKQNKQPYIGTVEFIPADGPWVVYDSNLIKDDAGNDNGMVDYTESILLDVTLENVGSEISTSVSAVLSTDDEYITITDNTETWGDINAGTALTATDAFAFDVADNVPDQHQVTFTITSTDNNGDSWVSTFTVTINAPNLVINGYEIDDSATGNDNGRLEAGETVNIILNSSNIGAAECSNTSGTVTSSNQFFSMSQNVHNFGTMTSGTTDDGVFEMSVSDAPCGEEIQMNYVFESGAYSDELDFSEIVGLFDEDYETGDFSAYEWTTGGNSDWFVTEDFPYEGDNCVQSGAIDDEERSDLEITLDVIADGDIKFYYFVQSEENYDFLKFYIDDVEQGAWSGCGCSGYLLASYPVTEGEHTFKWSYIKDQSVLDGTDMAKIDYILFPPIAGDLSSVDDKVLSESFMISPNPSNGQFQVNLLGNSFEAIEVFDMTGKLVETKNINSNQMLVNLDLGHLSDGVYQVKLTGLTKVELTSIVLKK